MSAISPIFTVDDSIIAPHLPVIGDTAMTAAARLELDAWRIVSRNLAIAAALAGLGELVRATIAIDELAIRRVLDDRVDTVCAWSSRGRAPASSRATLSSRALLAVQELVQTQPR
ncbi:MAG: hypothetical protein IAG13_04855, partial [Deltaproteobacteria bacterium]|nr:hypothetical protein [Nannocystaceae bacterium]